MWLPEFVWGMIVGGIISPLMIYGIYEFILRKKESKNIKKENPHMTKKEIKQKLREMFDDNKDNEGNSTDT